jgi:hypothetical protein
MRVTALMPGYIGIILSTDGNAAWCFALKLHGRGSFWHYCADIV